MVSVAEAIDTRRAINYRLSDSKKRILYVSPAYRLSQGAFPLGAMYIVASLQKAGHHVEVIDMDAVNLPEKEYLRELKERRFDYLCTGGMITAWNFVNYTADVIKEIKPYVKIIVGGGIISSTPKSLVSVSKIDVGVVGEGEDTVLDIIEAFENGRSLSTVDGIVFKENGQVIQTQPREDRENLDELPFPAWDAFNVAQTYARYPSNGAFWRAKRLGSIYTTRGCPFRCTFCYTEKAVRQRSIPNVIEELKELKRRFGIHHVMIADDLFVVRKTRTIEFCEAMIKHKMNMSWSATGRCNIIDRPFLKIMKRAGCEFMGLGIESGSATVLKAIKKMQTPEQIIEAVKMVKEAGIIPGGTFILGLPPETKETIRETVNVYKTINNYRSHVNRFFFATPYPGTELYDQMRAKGRIPDEIKYFEMISERGECVAFALNCTDSMTDEELIKMKADVEEEVLNDFMRKHPFSAIHHFLLEKTPWEKIRVYLVIWKIRGFRESVDFLWKKLLAKLGIIPDRYQHRWNKKKSYAFAQNLIEGRVVTF